MGGLVMPTNRPEEYCYIRIGLRRWRSVAFEGPIETFLY